MWDCNMKSLQRYKSLGSRAVIPSLLTLSFPQAEALPFHFTQQWISLKLPPTQQEPDASGSGVKLPTGWWSKASVWCLSASKLQSPRPGVGVLWPYFCVALCTVRAGEMRKERLGAELFVREKNTQLIPSLSFCLRQAGEIYSSDFSKTITTVITVNFPHSLR